MPMLPPRRAHAHVRRVRAMPMLTSDECPQVRPKNASNADAHIESRTCSRPKSASNAHANVEARPCSSPKSASNAHATVEARPSSRPKSARNAHATVEARARKGRTLRPGVWSNAHACVAPAPWLVGGAGREPYSTTEGQPALTGRKFRELKRYRIF